jgi:TRAP-type C4-dicarboxylate transport system permease small subunit
MQFLKKIYQGAVKVELVACGIGFIALILFVFLSAILRFFRISLSWNIDMALLMLAWTAFLGADLAWRDGQLVGIDLVTRQLPKKVAQVIELLVLIVILFAQAIIFYYGARLAWVERVRRYQSMPIPYAVVTYSLVVSAFSMTISSFIKIYHSFRALITSEVAV